MYIIENDNGIGWVNYKMIKKRSNFRSFNPI